MSELSDKLFSSLKAIVPDIAAEVKRQGAQGASELAHALFNGNAYVPYGVGQQPTKSNEGVEPEPQQPPSQNVEHDRGGRSL